MNLLPPTRREFLILAGLATGKLGLEAEPLRRGSYLLRPATTGSEQARPRIDEGFASLAEVFAAPCSPFFGVRMEGRVESFGNGASGQRVKRVARDPETYYMAGGISGEEEPHSFFLSFEISNQQILCSATSTGCLQNPLVYSRQVSAHRRGKSFQSPELLGGSAWSFGLQRVGGSPQRLPMTHGSMVKLLDALYPIFEHECEGLQFASLAFAPDGGSNIPQNPRAIVVAMRVRNPSQERWKGALLTPALMDANGPATAAWIANPAESPHPRFTEHPLPIQPGYEAMACLKGTEWSGQPPAVALDIAAGETRHLSFALLLDSSADRVKQTASVVQGLSALEWFNRTWKANAQRYGTLAIEGGEYYADFLRRQVEEDRSATMMSDGGEIFDGGPSGATFSLAYFQPGIPGHGLHTVKDFKKRPAGQQTYSDISYSLTNSLGLLPWAGLYYRMTGDAEAFKESAGFLDYAEETLADILAARTGDAYLFPSKMLWDGPTPGDYNTGANILAWLGFQSSARIAGEVYRRADLQSQWRSIADRIRADLYKLCIGPSPIGPRFYQGANRDGNFVHGHDGEEAFTTMAAFFGFCDADEPALMRHAKLAFTDDNPLYAAEVDGIWWDSKTFGNGTTMPGQIAKLIAASDEHELAVNLAGLRKLVDLDGSLWWWPYLYPCADPRMVERRGHPADTSKCGYAAAVFTTVFLTNILGILTDIPAREVSFRPFTPWPQVHWDECRLGPALFDFDQHSSGSACSASIVNKNSIEYSATLEITLPAKFSSARAVTRGLFGVELKKTARFGRTAMRAFGTVGAGERAELVLDMS